MTVKACGSLRSTCFLSILTNIVALIKESGLVALVHLLPGAARIDSLAGQGDEAFVKDVVR